MRNKASIWINGWMDEYININFKNLLCSLQEIIWQSPMEVLPQIALTGMIFFIVLLVSQTRTLSARKPHSQAVINYQFWTLQW